MGGIGGDFILESGNDCDGQREKDREERERKRRCRRRRATNKGKQKREKCEKNEKQLSNQASKKMRKSGAIQKRKLIANKKESKYHKKNKQQNAT